MKVPEGSAHGVGGHGGVAAVGVVGAGGGEARRPASLLRCEGVLLDVHTIEQHLQQGVEVARYLLLVGGYPLGVHLDRGGSRLRHGVTHDVDRAGDGGHSAHHRGPAFVRAPPPFHLKIDVTVHSFEPRRDRGLELRLFDDLFIDPE